MATASASVASALPPGKAIWPEWLDMRVVRWVNSTLGPPRSEGCSTMGINTEACTGARSVKRGSARTSGCQDGGNWKRWRKASGCNAEAATAGRCASPPTTGTRRGSKLGSLDRGMGEGWDTKAMVRPKKKPPQA